MKFDTLGEQTCRVPVKFDVMGGGDNKQVPISKRNPLNDACATRVKHNSSEFPFEHLSRVDQFIWTLFGLLLVGLL